jgi:hypothetical protein
MVCHPAGLRRQFRGAPQGVDALDVAAGVKQTPDSQCKVHCGGSQVGGRHEAAGPERWRAQLQQGVFDATAAQELASG